MKTIATLSVSILLAGGLIFAQGRLGGTNPNMPTRSTCVNLAQAQTITGTITAVDIAYGAQYPSITVNQIAIKVAPLWFLLEQDFELQVGDSVTVVAAPCVTDSYLLAISVTNNVTSASITLRDSNGLALWSGAAGGHRTQRFQAMAKRSGFDPPSVRTTTGTVERATFGVGIQMPTLVVKATDGTLVTMKIGPERVLLAADFELNAGEPVTATYASCLRDNWALQLTNSAGVTIVLRNPDGTLRWD